MIEYNDSEWEAIEAAVASVRPKQSLTSSERKELCTLSELYLVSRNSPRQVATKEQKKLWSDVGKLSDKLSLVLSAALDSKAPHEPYRPDRYAKLLNSLKSMSRSVECFSGLNYSRPGSPSPHAIYYRYVLMFWTDRLSANLGISRHRIDKTPQGPLVRFFCAVCAPVMREDMPSLETVADIVSREKNLRVSRRAAE